MFGRWRGWGRGVGGCDAFLTAKLIKDPRGRGGGHARQGVPNKSCDPVQLLM